MVPGTHRDMVLIEDLSDIVRMHARQVEGENTKPSLAGVEQFETGDPRQPVDAISGQCLLMLEDVVTPKFFDVVDSRSEPYRARDVRGASFEPVRRKLKVGFVESDVEDHLAAALPRRHFREQIVAPIEYADPGRSVDLVTGQGLEVAA